MTCWRESRFQAPPTSDGSTCVGKNSSIIFHRTAGDGGCWLLYDWQQNTCRVRNRLSGFPQMRAPRGTSVRPSPLRYPTTDDVRSTKNERVRFTHSEVIETQVECPVISFARQATTRSGQAISFFRGYQPTVYSAASCVDSHITDQQARTRNFLLSEP